MTRGGEDMASKNNLLSVDEQTKQLTEQLKSIGALTEIIEAGLTSLGMFLSVFGTPVAGAAVTGFAYVLEKDAKKREAQIAAQNKILHTAKQNAVLAFHDKSTPELISDLEKLKGEAEEACFYGQTIVELRKDYNKELQAAHLTGMEPPPKSQMLVDAEGISEEELIKRFLGAVGKILAVERVCASRLVDVRSQGTARAVCHSENL